LFRWFALFAEHDIQLSDKVTEANLTIDERRWKLADTIKLFNFHQKIRPKNIGNKVTPYGPSQSKIAHNHLLVRGKADPFQWDWVDLADMQNTT
jgi:hypothetical protein